MIYTLKTKKLTNLLKGFNGQLHWCELLNDTNRPVNQLVQKTISTLENENISVTLHKITGHPFWGASSVVDVPDLTETTCMIFSE